LVDEIYDVLKQMHFMQNGRGFYIGDDKYPTMAGKDSRVVSGGRTTATIRAKNRELGSGDRYWMAKQPG
jgi:hypothetical protein